MRPARVTPTRLLVAALALALAAGCSALPVEGPVRTEPVDRGSAQSDAPYFNPPGPAEDGTPSAIVSGFMVAMQANPLTTSVARSFLSEQARSTWRPNRGTIVYEAFTVQQTTPGARVRLSDVRRLDSRGGWRRGQPGTTETLDVRLVSEDGQWRIDNPPNALVVPQSYFERVFSRYNLYFYDQTDRVLVPDPVFLPRGEQTATNLVRGLLSGPGQSLSEVTRSAIPARTSLDLAVVVTESGVAEVPLSREMLRASPSDLVLAMDQMAWTLRQVPGIERVRITVAGAPVPLPDSRVDVPVTSGSQRDAGGDTEATLWGLRDGRVVDVGRPDGQPADGPLGRRGFSMRSLAVTASPPKVAAVSGDGTTLFVAAADAESRRSPATAPFEGTDLLRPSYDMLGDLWLVDRTRTGARLYVLRGDRVREVRVPGVTGADVAAISVAHDGSRLAVALAGSPAPPVRVVPILRTSEGVVTGAGRVRAIQAGVGDSARLIDIGWRDPATLALLSRPTAETSRVTYLAPDGSPVSTALPEPSVFRGPAAALAVAPDGNLPLHVVTPAQQLYTLAGNGQWVRDLTGVRAVTYGH